jgi:hypothetical protein
MAASLPASIAAASSTSSSSSSNGVFTLPPVNTTSYPRDMIGYNQRPPHPQWPGAARVAVQFVLNYEEGGENSILHGDKSSEWLLSDIGIPVSHTTTTLYYWHIYYDFSTMYICFVI